MVVQHNMQAMNANRMLGITTRSQSKATEKLSSGYKINRAADDAAGLSISEKMRKQMRGLDQASTNAQDGISAVQTAEGALTEVHAMLQRMNELAVQAANGTNAESDRQSIQDEIEQLTTEIDRVAETTKFNESYLLKGNGKETTINIAAKDAGIAGELTGVGTGLATFKMSALDNGEQITIGSKGYTIGTSIEDVKANIPAATDDNTKVTINGTEYHVVEDGATDPANKYYTQAELQSMISDGDKVVIGSESYVAMIDGTGATAAEAQAALKAAVTAGDTVTIGGKAYTITSGNDTDLKDGLALAKAEIQSKIDTIGSDTITIGGTAYTAGNIDTLDLDTAVTATTAFNVGNGDVAVGTGA
ncbi:MAG: flagellar hook protein, partial [Agathobacter sp.]|nr:flagellar hook protein [Agathobacter sp.]